MKNYVQRRTYSNDNLFEALDDFFRPMFYEEATAMKTDIRETESEYQLEIEVPGFKKEEIKVSLENGYLTVGCKKQMEEKTEGNGKFPRYVRKEICESCQRSYYVGDEIEESNVKAKYENGILTLCIPKAMPKQVTAHSIAIE